VATDVVGISMRGYEMVDPVNIVATKIRKYVGTIVSIVASIDEHRLSTWADDERAHRLPNVDEVDLEGAVCRYRDRLVACSWWGLVGRLNGWAV
jgi:hypothetical protein